MTRRILQALSPSERAELGRRETPRESVSARHAQAVGLLGQAWSVLEDEVSPKTREEALTLAEAAVTVLRGMVKR